MSEIRVDIRTPDASTLTAVRPILERNFSSETFGDDRLLDHQYLRPPFKTFVTNAVADGTIVGHVGGQEVSLVGADGPHTALLQVNFVVEPAYRMKGVARTLLSAAAEHAVSLGYLGLIGVLNESGVLSLRLPNTMSRQLPVVGVTPALRPDRAVEHQRVTEANVAEVAAAMAELIGTPTPEGSDLMPVWDPARLAWRLLTPGLAPYSVHVGTDVMAVSTVRSRSGVPVAVVVRVWPIGQRSEPPVLDGRFGRSIANHHRVAAVIHAGFNPDVKVKGISIPERLRPAPFYYGYNFNEYPPRSFELLEFDVV